MAGVPGAFGAFSGLGCPLLAPPPVRESFLLLPGPQGRSPNWQAACWPRHCPRGAPCCGSSRVEGSCVQGFPLAALTPPGKFFLPISSFPQILSKPPDSGILFSGPGPPMISQDHLPASNLCPYGKRLRHMWRPQPGPGGFRLRSSCWSSPGGTPGLAGALVDLTSFHGNRKGWSPFLLAPVQPSQGARGGQRHRS